MTGLLVSVRDADEARQALDGGADLIDVKEPLRGSLGAASPNVWIQVANTVHGTVPLSVALGELLFDAPPSLQQHHHHLTRFSFAKIGLAGCRQSTNWKDRLAGFMGELPSSVASVAVIYADGERAESPAPAEVRSFAVKHSCGALLVDTFDKSGGDLLSHWSLPQIQSFVEASRKCGLTTVLGGSLGHDSICKLLRRCRPDFIAVRGAVCAGPRTDELQARRVRRLADAIAKVAKSAPRAR